MKNLVKKAVLLILFLSLTAGMIVCPKRSLFYALTGLTLWYEKMIPALLPFMILSNLLIGLHLTDSFVFFLKPILSRLFHLNGHGVYAIFIGFLCGFPMGAKVTADLYRRHLLSKTEAQDLLIFCNNIGPIYFTSFVLMLLQVKNPAPFLVGMYGIPFLYGIYLLRLRRPLLRLIAPFSPGKRRLRPELSAEVLPQQPQQSLLDILDDSIMSALSGIAKLGGYMVLFNLLNLLPDLLLSKNTCFLSLMTHLHIPVPVLLAAVNCLLEITSGISRTGGHYPFLVLVFLPFGGFSCIAQTYSMIKGTDLSLGKYVYHKCILTLLTALYYLLIL